MDIDKIISELQSGQKDDAYFDNLLARALAENREWERQFNILMAHQGNGREAESHKCLEEAIDGYRQAIEYGRSADRMCVNNYYRSYERIVILLRKLKDYDREIEFIKLALTEPDIVDDDRAWFEDRLTKAETLKAKQK